MGGSSLAISFNAVDLEHRFGDIETNCRNCLQEPGPPL